MKHKRNHKLGDFVRAAHIRKTFSKGDITFCSYKLYTINEIIHDTIPSYRNNYLPERYNKNLSREWSLSFEENDRIMKKLKLFQLKQLLNGTNRKPNFWKVYQTVYTMFEKKFYTWWIQWSYIACGCNAIKRKRNIPKVNVQTIKFINPLKISEKRIKNMDTHSFVLSVNRINPKDLQNLIDLCDSSNHEKKVMNFSAIKRRFGRPNIDTPKNNWIEESFKCIDRNTNKLKSISKSQIKFCKTDEYYNCLFGGNFQKECDNYVICSINPEIYLQKVTKVSLSAFD